MKRGLLMLWTSAMVPLLKKYALFKKLHEAQTVFRMFLMFYMASKETGCQMLINSVGTVSFRHICSKTIKCEHKNVLCVV